MKKKIAKFIRMIVIVGVVGVAGFVTVKYYSKISTDAYKAPVQQVNAEDQKKQQDINNYMETESFKQQALASAELWWNKKHLNELQTEEAKTNATILELKDKGF